MATARGQESPFHVYVPVGVSYAAREMFRNGCKAAMRKFADSEKKHGWNDYWMRAPEEDIRAALREHVEKGDARDVVVLALICLARGIATNVTPTSPGAAAWRSLVEGCAIHHEEAEQLALMNCGESNLARCYLELLENNRRKAT